MALYWKAAAAVLLAVVLSQTVGKQEKDLALVLSMGVCCLTAMAAFDLLLPVLDFLYGLQQLGEISADAFGILLKVLGIGLVSEVAILICRDSGREALGRSLQLLGSALILQLSLPLFEGVLDLIRSILGEL